MRPARLEPIFVPRIWGAPSLDPLFPGKRNVGSSEAIGEVWLTGNECRFTDGPFAGRRLADAWREMPAEWAGTRMDRRAAFPLLVKFLFPADDLSVQVHPDDDYARKYEAAAGGMGKTEMWYAVAAQPGSKVCVGLKPGVTREQFRRAIDDGSVKNYLTCVPLAPGEAIFVPAGTAHTIGPGFVLCEVQENSDITYRVYDFGRLQADGKPRTLHIEKSLEVINFGTQRGGKLTPARAPAHGGEIAHYVACRHFAVETWNFAAPIDLRTEPDHFELWIVIAGSGRMKWTANSGAGESEAAYAPGEVWFVPARLDSWRIEPAASTTMLHAYVPDLDRYAAQLAACGISAKDAALILKG